MKKLLALLKKDIYLGIKDIFIILEILFAVIFAVVLILFIPEDIENPGLFFIYDQTGLMETALTAQSPDAAEKAGMHFTDGRSAVIDGMTENASATGLIIKELPDGKYKADMLIQPYTKTGLIEYIKTQTEDLMSILTPPAGRYPKEVYGSVRIEAIHTGTAEPVPFNRRILPPFLMMNVGLVGLFAMVSLIGQERAEMTLRAYRVSPSGLGLFLLSKHIMMLGVSIVTFSILYIPMMGLKGYPQSLLVMTLTVLLMSSVGVVLAGFYKGAMASMGWVFILMVVLSLPAVSLLNPVFSPAWLRLIPSFHTLFGLDAVMFGTGGSGRIFTQSIIILSVLNIPFLAASFLLFDSRIRKEA